MGFENFVDDVWQDDTINKFAVSKAQKQLSQIFLELNHIPKHVINLGITSAAGISLESSGI